MQFYHCELIYILLQPKCLCPELPTDKNAFVNMGPYAFTSAATVSLNLKLFVSVEQGKRCFEPVSRKQKNSVFFISFTKFRLTTANNTTHNVFVISFEGYHLQLNAGNKNHFD